MPGIDDLKRKYTERINESLAPQRQEPELSSRQYKAFRAQYLPTNLTLYEKACNISERVMKVSPDKKQRPKLEEAVQVCHLEVTPEGVLSFSIMGPVSFIVLVAFLSFLLPITMNAVMDTNIAGSLFFMLFGLFAGLGMILPLQKLPYYLANAWRMKASNQMVLCVFYIVTYMRHTSNLELAVDFAGEHLAPPLSLDMKKVIWDIETEKYDSVKESLDMYLDTWKEWNPEFIESMHLIEGSLLESSETRRIELLDKSLSVMLEETYEKMLHYAHNLKSPLTTLHMLGVILPILGLVILPLMVSFMPEVKWYHMAAMYNLTLPILVYLLAKNILSTRPTGYGNADISEMNPELKKFKDLIIPLGGKDRILLSPFVVGIVIVMVLVVIGCLPVVYHYAAPEQDWVIANGEFLQTLEGSEAYGQASYYFLNYRPVDAKDPSSPRSNGPYGMGAILLSLLIPVGLGVGSGVYYRIRSKDVIKIRERTMKLEQEFAAALFQLGNRLGDGIPTEIAFGKVAGVLQGTHTGKFFDTVTDNITRMGMDVERAIFDKKRGALMDYPSNIIESSMKVLVESSKKGPLIASRAVIGVSEYIQQMHRVDERLRDLMSDVISSMKSQISFLTPVIAGVVIGITSMIAAILGTVAQKLYELGQVGDFGSAGGAGAIFDVFGAGGIPTYHFQVIVGLFVVQITAILTVMVNGIENGSDGLAKESLLGTNLLRAALLYAAISAGTVILFGMIAGRIAIV